MRRSKSMIVVAVAVSAVGVGAWHKRLYIQLSLAGAGGLGAAVTTREFFHAPGGVDEFLFAGKKRMAGGADPDFYVSFSRAGVINHAARANALGFLILTMNDRIHYQKRPHNLDSKGQR